MNTLTRVIANDVVKNYAHYGLVDMPQFDRLVPAIRIVKRITGDSLVECKFAVEEAIRFSTVKADAVPSYTEHVEKLAILSGVHRHDVLAVLEAQAELAGVGQ